MKPGKYPPPETRWVGNPAPYAGQGPAWTFDWGAICPSVCERRLDVSGVAGALADGVLSIAYSLRVQPSGLAADAPGYRWVWLGDAFTGPTAPDPTIAGIHPRATFLLPAFADMIRVSSTYLAVGGGITNVMLSLYPNATPQCAYCL